MTKYEEQEILERFANGENLESIFATMRARKAHAREAREAWKLANDAIVNGEGREADKVTEVLLQAEEYAYNAVDGKASRHDHGRHGDLIESNVKAILAGNWVRAKAIHVAAPDKADCTFKGQRVEVGSNGKTFASRDIGKWEKKSYELSEVLSEEIAFVAYCVNATQVIEEAAYEEKVYMFTRAQFADFLTKSGRNGLYSMTHVTQYGRAITAQYNENWAKRFTAWVADNGIPTLGEFVKANR